MHPTLKHVLIPALACLFGASAALLPLALGAAPMDGEVLEFEQPDGTAIRLKVYGDFYAHFESLDGYAVIQDPETGYFTYADRSADGEDLIPTSDPVGLALIPVKARKAGFETRGHRPSAKGLRIPAAKRARLNREAAALLGGPIDSNVTVTPGYSQPTKTPVAGCEHIRGLTLIISFPDVPATIPREEVERFFNQTGYNSCQNNGSVRDYFLDVSEGHVDYLNDVSAYYVAKQPRSYYTDPSIGLSIRAAELVTEAVTALVAQGHDFSNLSLDATGAIRAVNVLYAGPLVNNWSQGLWPHTRWSGAIAYNANGVKVTNYQMVSMGSCLKLGMVCHENGHLLFRWPDLYDYGFESGGLGNYCLMSSSGGINPNFPNPALRHLQGWIQPQAINGMSPGTQLSVRANTSDCYRYANPADSGEAFYIEAQRRTGRRTIAASEGLAIWHYSASGSNDHQQGLPYQHYKVALEQGDGRFDLESRLSWGDADDLYCAERNHAFNDHSLPDARWWSGGESGLQVSDISPIGDQMSFIVSGIEPTPSETAGPYLLTHSATPSVTNSQSPTTTPSTTPSATLTETPAATATTTPTPARESGPEPTALPAIASDCAAEIERLVVSPNPQTARADRMVSVKLGCSADRIVVEIFSLAMSPLFSWEVADVHVQRGQWAHLRYPHDVSLPNGAYYVRATAYKGATQDQQSTVFVVLN